MATSNITSTGNTELKIKVGEGEPVLYPMSVFRTLHRLQPSNAPSCVSLFLLPRNTRFVLPRLA